VATLTDTWAGLVRCRHRLITGLAILILNQYTRWGVRHNTANRHNESHISNTVYIRTTWRITPHFAAGGRTDGQLNWPFSGGALMGTSKTPAMRFTPCGCGGATGEVDRRGLSRQSSQWWSVVVCVRLSDRHQSRLTAAAARPWAPIRHRSSSSVRLQRRAVTSH